MVQQSTNNIFENVYKFNGKELDEQTGYYYYGARYYDPGASIFLSVDPLAEKMPHWNPYTYTFNNPINFTDPTGMVPEGKDDHWQLNEGGKLEMIKKTDDNFNTFFDKDGNKLFQTNQTAEVELKQASNENRLDEYINDMKSTFIEVSKNSEVYSTMDLRAKETGFDGSIMSLADMKATGENYLKQAPFEATLNFIPTAIEWISGAGFAKATPGGLQDVFDVGSNLYRGKFGTDLKLDAGKIWNNFKQQTKETLNNMRNEYNKGVRQLQNMPINMR